jgi:hypothetical protein
VVRALAEPVAQQDVVVVVRVARAAGGAENVLRVDARVRVVLGGGGGGGGFVVGVDGWFFNDLRGVRVRLREIQSLEQLSDAELGVEDLRARLRDLSGGAEFLAAAVRGRAKACFGFVSASNGDAEARRLAKKENRTPRLMRLSWETIASNDLAFLEREIAGTPRT